MLSIRSAPLRLDRWMPNGTKKLAPPVNHVFVDFENIHEIDLAVVGRNSVSFTLLLGPRQTKLDVTLVEKLMEHAASVHLVRLSSTGPNALDFTLAYYIGCTVAADPTGYFHIVSKDKGFDPLVEHLRTHHIRAHRHDDFASLPFLASSTSKTATGHDPYSRALDHLRKCPNNRPTHRKKLVNCMRALLGNGTAEEQIHVLIEGLLQSRQLTIDADGAVSYHLHPR
jgi:hypothetical protein